MAADLPPGRWSAVLVGPWWPAPSAALRAAAQHWATWAMQKQELARNLISQHDLLSRNLYHLPRWSQHPPLLHRQSSPLAPGGDARRVAVAGGPRTGRIAYVDWAIVCDRDGDGATGRGWRAFAVGRGNDGDAVGVGSPAAGHSSDNDTARGVCADHGCGHRSHTRAS